nr:reverse transcriptase domain-containing protein [Tanacetum cinerariifolium]
ERPNIPLSFIVPSRVSSGYILPSGILPLEWRLLSTVILWVTFHSSFILSTPCSITLEFLVHQLVSNAYGILESSWIRRHFRKDCPKLRNQNHGNQTRNKTGNKTGGNEVIAKIYAIGRGGTNPFSNVVTGTFLFNNCYASMLFDSGADRSFVSTTFSALLDVAPLVCV